MARTAPPARFRIIGHDLPGSRCVPSPERPGGYEHVHVGVQRDRDVVQLDSGDASQVVFEFDVTVRPPRVTWRVQD